MTGASILFKASLAFTHASSLTRLSLPTQAGRLRRGRGGRRLRGKVPLLLARRRTPSEIHPAGAGELRVFKEFACRLSILTLRARPNPKTMHSGHLSQFAANPENVSMRSWASIGDIKGETPRPTRSSGIGDRFPTASKQILLATINEQEPLAIEWSLGTIEPRRT